MANFDGLRLWRVEAGRATIKAWAEADTSDCVLTIEEIVWLI